MARSQVAYSVDDFAETQVILIMTNALLSSIILLIIRYKRIFSLNARRLRNYIEKSKDKRRSAPPSFILKRHQTHELTVSGRVCYVISTKNTGPVKTAVLFLHGGGMLRFLEKVKRHWMRYSISWQITFDATNKSMSLCNYATPRFTS